jgi:uncharacterized protein YfaP (DUF2135 family)
VRPAALPGDQPWRCTGRRRATQTIFALAAAAVAVVGLILAATPAAAQGDTLVSVDSPASPFAQNKQDDPSVALDASYPMVVAAGANDEIGVKAYNTAA